MLLEIVALARDIGGDVFPVGEAHTSGLALTGVGLLGTGDADFDAYALHGRGVHTRKDRGNGATFLLWFPAALFLDMPFPSD